MVAECTAQPALLVPSKRTETQADWKREEQLEKERKATRKCYIHVTFLRKNGHTMIDALQRKSSRKAAGRAENCQLFLREAEEETVFRSPSLTRCQPVRVVTGFFLLFRYLRFYEQQLICKKKKINKLISILILHQFLYECQRRPLLRNTQSPESELLGRKKRRDK